MTAPVGTVTGGHRLAAFLREAQAAQRSGINRIEVGFYDTSRYPPVRTGVEGGQAQQPNPVTLVALWNEFGTRDSDGNQATPERPFFRNAIEDSDDDMVDLLRAQIDTETMVVTPRIARVLGTFLQGRIQQSITDLKTPANAPVTVKGGWIRRGGKSIYIKGKQSRNPLLGTGFMRASVTYKTFGGVRGESVVGQEAQTLASRQGKIF